MMEKVLCTKNLVHVRDGQLRALLDQKLGEVYADCNDRPGLTKARSVTLKIEIKPTGDDPMEEADITFKVDSSIPAQAFSRQMKSRSSQNGFGFEADTDSVDHAPNQPTFED